MLEERSQAKCTHKDSERPRIQRLGYKLGTLLVLSSTTHHGTRVGTSSLSVLAGWTSVGGDRPPRDRPSFPPARNIGLDDASAEQIVQILTHMPIEEAFATLILAHHLPARDAIGLVEAVLDDAELEQ